MKIVGGGDVIELGPEEEGHHPKGDDPEWQESVVLVWWDSGNEVGGVHRIGHEPNVPSGPKITLWNHIFTRDHVFKRAVTLPLRPEDQGHNRFGCGDDGCTFEYTDHAVWTFNEPEVQGQLHVEDVHKPVDLYPKKGSLGEDFAPNHMEVAGVVTGMLTVEGKTFTINGMAFRDHGWGIRKWHHLLSHRWVVGLFEPNYAFLANIFHGVDNQMVRFGCVMRDNTLTYTKEADVLVYMEPDGVTHRGGRVSMTLTTGEVLEIEATPFQKGVVSWVHEIACVDALCKITMGDREGICNFETSTNAMQGRTPPLMAINGILENGLTKTS